MSHSLTNFACLHPLCFAHLLTCSHSLLRFLTCTHRFLDHATAAAALSEFITPSELQAMLSRKDNILAYFDRLVQDQGYRSVVLEDTSDVATRAEAPAAAAGVAA